VTAHFLFRHPRLLMLVVALIAVAGLSSYIVLPRMEDPILGKRVAVITTTFPGADAEQVEHLVTSELEQQLRDIAEIQELESVSRSGVSSVVVALRDEVTNVEPIWSRVRNRLRAVRDRLPGEVSDPEFKRLELRAFSMLIALKWCGDEPVDFGMLRPLAADLRRSLETVAGTQEVEIVGAPREEIIVRVDPHALRRMRLSPGAIAEQIGQSISRQPAGHLRGDTRNMAVDVASQAGVPGHLRETPIHDGPQGDAVRLELISNIRRENAASPSSLVLVDGAPAIVLAALVREDFRVDQFTDQLRSRLDEFRGHLPPPVELDVLFAQSDYVMRSMDELLGNLAIATAAVVLVVFLLMGWRSTLVVGTMLPLVALMVLSGMRLLGIPIHQMSITGLIIALGLLIDNAIVMVDDIRGRMERGVSRAQAIRAGTHHLLLPLLSSTLTTTLAFAPIALLPGPPGEYVAPVAVSVMLAVNSSFLLSMTVVPSFTALLQGRRPSSGLMSNGMTSRRARRGHEAALAVVLRSPWLGLAVGATLPVAGFLLARELPEQFFPPAERNQIYVDLELPTGSPMSHTRRVAQGVRDYVLRHDDVHRIHWFLGRSAPPFFYNVVPRRSNAPHFGQAIVELDRNARPGEVIRSLQRTLDNQFPGCRILVRQLEQGPPFDAPVELRLQGPDLAQLQWLGSRARRLLSGIPHVLHTRADLEETVPEVVVQLDQTAVALSGLNQQTIAQQLYGALEGIAAGSILEGSDELPIVVRRGQPDQLDLPRLAALPLQPPPSPLPNMSAPADQPVLALPPPLAALGALELDTDVAAITRVNGQRTSQIKAYITAGTLPSQVLEEFQQRWAQEGPPLPPGCQMSFGGESAERDEAVQHLLADVAVLITLMLAILVATFRSFRIALIIGLTGGLAGGLGLAALWLFDYPLGFMAIVGTMGLVGIAVNDAIVVMAGIREDPAARRGLLEPMQRVVVARTRHVIATSVTTIAGFTPLVLAGGGFWPPLAIAIAGGVAGATLLALYFVPSLYTLLCCHGWRRCQADPSRGKELRQSQAVK